MTLSFSKGPVKTTAGVLFCLRSENLILFLIDQVKPLSLGFSMDDVNADEVDEAQDDANPETKGSLVVAFFPSESLLSYQWLLRRK